MLLWVKLTFHAILSSQDSGLRRRNLAEEVNTNIMLIKFLLYGFLGWSTEIIYTGLGSLLQGDWRLRGFTYLWMFPIYGLGLFLESIHNRIRGLPWLVRGGIWLGLIWSLEFCTGWLLKLLTGSCPWDYTGSAYSIYGFIRLDMALEWFLFGLMFEHVHDYLDRKLKRGGLVKPF